MALLFPNCSSTIISMAGDMLRDMAMRGGPRNESIASNRIQIQFNNGSYESYRAPSGVSSSELEMLLRECGLSSMNDFYSHVKEVYFSDGATDWRWRETTAPAPSDTVSILPTTPVEILPPSFAKYEVRILHKSWFAGYHVPEWLIDKAKVLLLTKGWILGGVNWEGNELVISVQENGTISILMLATILVGILAIVGVIGWTVVKVEAENTKQKIQEASITLNEFKTTVQEGVNSGVISPQEGSDLIEGADQKFDQTQQQMQQEQTGSGGGLLAGIGGGSAIALLALGVFALGKKR